MNQFNQNKATWDRNYNRGKVKSHSRNLPINEFDSLGKHDFWLHVYCAARLRGHNNKTLCLNFQITVAYKILTSYEVRNTRRSDEVKV